MKPEQWDYSKETFSAFKERLQPAQCIDRFDLLLEDLFLIRNPKYKFIPDHTQDAKAFTESYAGGKQAEELGEWFFFPWNRTLVHYLPDDEHQEIRTARNRNIITAEEQTKLYGLTVAYAGLSVGSHGALTFALMGGARHMKLADPDEVSASNLNRIRYDYLALGRKKTDLALEYLYQLNPYAEIDAYPDGVTDANMDEFLSGVDVLVEETDNLEMKIRLRLAARERGIPVVMATDNGDNIIMEVERFDLDSKKPLFNGVIGDVTLEMFKSFAPSDLPKLATKIAGPHLITERMMASVAVVGREIYSWPQLGDAATLSGVAIAYVLKRLALKEPVREEKCEISLDGLLDPEYHAPHVTKRREDARAAFLEAVGL